MQYVGGAKGPEALPSHALRIFRPRLVRERVAARRVLLRQDGPLGFSETVLDLAQLVGGLDLNAQMVQARRAPDRNGEVDKRIAERPLRVVRLEHGRLRTEQG